LLIHFNAREGKTFYDPAFTVAIPIKPASHGGLPVWEKFAADKKAGRRVEDTQYLDALLGSEVFPLIQQLGIGARGMDTPAEREFLRKVMTGTINLDKNTLIRMAELRRRALVDNATRYNSRVDSGELDAMFAATHRSKQKINIPKGDAKSASEQFKLLEERINQGFKGDEFEFDLVNYLNLGENFSSSLSRLRSDSSSRIS
jgi:hypothetical protein